MHPAKARHTVEALQGSRSLLLRCSSLFEKAEIRDFGQKFVTAALVLKTSLLFTLFSAYRTSAEPSDFVESELPFGHLAASELRQNVSDLSQCM